MIVKNSNIILDSDREVMKVNNKSVIHDIFEIKGWDVLILWLKG